MARLIHLNGPPAVGKSALARRYAANHPGTLVCDVDVLRTLVGGWQGDDDAAGRIRTAALAMTTAYLGTGHDVVVPQLVARADQLDRFRAAADQASAEYAHVLMVAHPDVVVRRVRQRAADHTDEWTSYATGRWDAAGGDAAVREWVARLDEVDPDAVRVPSTDLDEAYAGLLRALGEPS